LAISDRPLSDDTIEAEAALSRLLTRYPDLAVVPPQEAQRRRAVSAVAHDDLTDAWRDIAMRPAERVDVDGVLDAMAVHRQQRRLADSDERHLIDMARRRGVSWAQIARLLGLTDGRAAQRRHAELIAQRAGAWCLHLIDVPGHIEG
jgi:hypothetical protein